MYIFIADFVYSLLNKAQREFHDMFLRTYGVMYENNAAVFQTYFRDLKTFYEKGLYSPLDSTDSFFNTLYQKMFQVNEIFSTMTSDWSAACHFTKHQMLLQQI